MKASILSACMLSAAVGIVSLLRPGKTLERQIRLLLSVLFVISLAAPLAQIEVPPELPVLAEEQLRQREAELTAEMNERVLAETKPRVEQALKDLLGAEGITCTKMEAELYIDGEGCIYCSDIRAECSDFAKACAILTEAAGEGVNICVTEILS